MSRPLLSAMALALLSAAPGWCAAANASRYSGSATLSPSAVATGGRFSLQSNLLDADAPLPSDAKQADPARSPASAEATPRFRLLASMRDKSAPEGTLCGAEFQFQNGFE